MSPLLLGLALVGFGTSIPKLVTSLVAAFEGSAGIAFGNVIRSNIYNVLGILGITAMVHSVAVPPKIMRLDIWILVTATAVLMLFFRTGWTLARWEGALFLAAYAADIGFLATNARRISATMAVLVGLVSRSGLVLAFRRRED